jgi:hypothetical protein
MDTEVEGEEEKERAREESGEILSTLRLTAKVQLSVGP